MTDDDRSWDEVTDRFERMKDRDDDGVPDGITDDEADLLRRRDEMMDARREVRRGREEEDLLRRRDEMMDARREVRREREEADLLRRRDELMEQRRRVRAERDSDIEAREPSRRSDSDDLGVFEVPSRIGDVFGEAQEILGGRDTDGDGASDLEEVVGRIGDQESQSRPAARRSTVDPFDDEQVVESLPDTELPPMESWSPNDPVSEVEVDHPGELSDNVDPWDSELVPDDVGGPSGDGIVSDNIDPWAEDSTPGATLPPDHTLPSENTVPSDNIDPWGEDDDWVDADGP